METGDMLKGRKKTRKEIIFDILNEIQKEKNAKKVYLMQRTCPDQRYLDFLVDGGFIAVSNLDPECYDMTETGKNFLKILQEI